MEFYAALSLCSSSIRKTAAKLADGYGSLEPLENVMFTPISQGETSHTAIRNLQDQFDLNVMFDSGGYEVQVGNKTFDDLQAYLHDFYGDNHWGHRYVLPDNVPLSQDSPKVVEQKVKQTADITTLFYRQLPDHLQERALAVIQGHTQDQLRHCLNTYKELDGLNYVGFGSFGTSGVSNGVNMLTTEAFHNLEWAVEQSHDAGMSVHAFGVGGPTSIPLLYTAGVDSFDTTSWMRSSGYGNVFFPFKSRYNASHRTNRSGNLLTKDELPHLKAETGHSCPFCESMKQLRNNRWDRIMHNLIVIHEMTNRVEQMSYEEIIDAMDEQSTYRRRLEQVTSPSRPKQVI
jgi:queuine/archaeosine tRNA-ribosyltransferase